jgi:hypothetical protein
MKMGNDLVSIIMLSHGDATYVEETVKSDATFSKQCMECHIEDFFPPSITN